MQTDQNKWLEWAQRLAALSQTGLTYAKDPFDVERYEAVREVAVEITAAHVPESAETLRNLFAAETGYATPKIGCRAAVMRGAGTSAELLLVEELAEDRIWTMPGGFCDIDDTPRSAIEREVFEETGYEVRATKLVAVVSRAHLPNPSPKWGILWHLLFLCEITGGTPKSSVETGVSGWFTQDQLPVISGQRTPAKLVELAFTHYADPALPAWYH